MALVKPTIIDPADGRQNGTRFYRSGGRTFARQIVKPVDPVNERQIGARLATAGGSKIWAYLLTPTQQAVWAAASQFGGRGDLEIEAAAVAAQGSGQPLPTVRGPGPNPPFPNIVEFIFNSSIPRMRVRYATPSPIANFITTMKINPPEPRTRLPRRAELVKFNVIPAASAPVALEAAYSARFGGGFPPRSAMMIEIYNYDIVTPAKGLIFQAVQTDQAETNSMRALLAPVPIPPFGRANISIRPNFGLLPAGTPIPMTINAPDFTITATATAQNRQNTPVKLDDVLGRKRTASVRITLTASPTDVIAVDIGPVVSI